MLRVEIALRGDTAKQFSTCVRRISWLLIRLFAYWGDVARSVIEGIVEMSQALHLRLSRAERLARGDGRESLRRS